MTTRWNNFGRDRGDMDDRGGWDLFQDFLLDPEIATVIEKF